MSGYAWHGFSHHCMPAQVPLPYLLIVLRQSAIQAGILPYLVLLGLELCMWLVEKGLTPSIAHGMLRTALNTAAVPSCVLVGLAAARAHPP
jgi:hypothetical protein